MVSTQVGVRTILLDSKCYPLLENESTREETFWRSTSKVLAANSGIYNKLMGICTNLQNASVDRTAEDSDSSGGGKVPSQKRPRVDAVSSSLNKKLDEIASSICSVQRLMTLMGNLNQTFQCVVVLCPPPLLPSVVGVLLVANNVLMAGWRIMQPAPTALLCLLSILCYEG